MRQHNSATNHLVGMFWVHTEIEVDFDRLVELQFGLFKDLDCFSKIVSLVTVDAFSNLLVFFSSEHGVSCQIRNGELPASVNHFNTHGASGARNHAHSGFEVDCV